MVPTTSHRLCCLIFLIAGVCQKSKAFIHPYRDASIRKFSAHSTVSVGTTTRTTTKTTLDLIGKNLFGGIFAPQGESANGPKVILDIPTNNIKIGPLKFFLQIFLVGEQNNPLPNSWVLNQSDETETLDMYHTDGTGMFSIDIKEYGMTVKRHGQAPSLQYQLQESVMLHALLDEVEGIAFAEDIDVEKRLLQLKDDNALQQARESLPARKES
ncbi:hypothetical protein IV203_033800 [Nitzschia inconspicua]|uniref:Uncharacterized protein n=1 Tax=Nitzschia inconspicua TaxID=303405 RepID=A0A9K3Q725_9STRA|nr:hypothetical protein IV203_033800 [Nitzschia inconspicua]